MRLGRMYLTRKSPRFSMVSQDADVVITITKGLR